MADISHDFYFYPLCYHCHTQAQEIKTKTVSNDVRLRRIEGSLIVICLIQREVISVNFVNSTVLNCNIACLLSTFEIFRCFFIVGRSWSPFNVKSVMF